jgi:hypothetical protein
VAVAHRPLIDAVADQWRRPEGPLALLFVGYPLWWLLGVVQPAVLAACVAMLARMLRERELTLPRGSRWWALWLVWVAAGALVLQVDVPGAVPGGSSTRYLTWGVRLLWFLEATVVLLYVARRRISPERVVRLLGWMFVTVVVCGVVGTLVPTLRLTSLMDIVLPAGLVQQPFLSSLVHPLVAEKHVYLGVVQYRPSGPFPYSNAWGLNYACFLPFFVVGWLRGAGGWRRGVALVVLASSIIPVVYSGNRGLWVVLGVLGALVLVKQAAAGRTRPLLWALVGTAAGAVVVVTTPLYDALTARLSGHTSNLGRASLTTLTVDAVSQGSPVIGLGTTRPVQGSFYSIAGGSTPSCPLCTPPALGTQGFLWLMLFGTGFVGCAIALAFWGGRLLRHLRTRSPIGIASLCVLVTFVLTLPIYDWTITSGIAAMTAVALLEHEVGTARVVAFGARRRLRSYVSPVTIGCVLVGGVAGGLVATERGPTYIARAAVYLPSDVDKPGTARLQSLDTEARWVLNPAVTGPSARLRALDEARHRGRITVDATANTRLLGISYSSTDLRRARDVATSLAESFLRERTERMRTERDATVAAARRQVQAGLRGTLAFEVTAASLPRTGSALSRAGLAVAEADLSTEIDRADRTTRELTPLDDLRGHLVGPVWVRSGRNWNVAVASGALLGLLVASALTTRARRARLQKGRHR